MAIAQEMRIKELEKQIADLHAQRAIEWVGARLGEALATQLAATPYARWTDSQKQTLHAVCGNAVVACALYLERLPQERKEA